MSAKGKIFLSHSTRDNTPTRQIATGLREADFDVWVDFDSIRDGQRWLREIQSGIDDCEAVVVVLSKDSRQSEWVERECLYAFDHQKPVFIALIDDTLLPLHLINIQFTDCRVDLQDGVDKLANALHHTLSTSGTPPEHLPDTMSADPTERNFFKYLEQLPQGEAVNLVAQDIYYWASQEADQVEFGGRAQPGFHTRIKLNEEWITVFSVWAYPRTPSVQVPFDTLQAYSPYTRSKLRRSTLKSLNQLLPNGIEFDEERADRRPNIALHFLDTAERLEAFKDIITEIINNLRSG